MTKNNAPFNQPSVTYNCQCCGDLHVGAPIKAPSGVVLGKVMSERYVCAECLDRYASGIKMGFCGTEPIQHQPGRCPGCSCELEAGDNHIAHIEPNSDGTWKKWRVCTQCFNEHAACCREIGNK